MNLTNKQAEALISLFAISRLTESWERLEQELRMSEDEIIEHMLAIREVREKLSGKQDGGRRPKAQDGRYLV